MITRFVRPASAQEALRIQKETANAVFIAGGTHLLAPAFRDRPMAAVSIEGLLPREIRASAELLSIGALATLQELVESGATDGVGEPAAARGAVAAGGGAPSAAVANAAAARGTVAGSAASTAGPELALLRDAASSMGSRNLRNRATVGGNVAANRATACLAPALLALDARLLLTGGSRQPIGDYLAAPGALIEAVEVPLVRGRATAYRRWARTASDISGVAVAVALRLSEGVVAGVRIAATGVGAQAGEGVAAQAAGPRPATGAQSAGSAAAAGSRSAAAGGVGVDASSVAVPGAVRLTAVEALFEGRALPTRMKIERSVLPLLEAASDIRAGADYRRLRAAQLIADALLGAAANAARSAGAAAGASGSAGTRSPAGGSSVPGGAAAANERGRGKESAR